MGPSVSVSVITLNEEGNIRACLESVSWADEVVVVDSGSTDRTVEIAREYTDRVVHHDWEGINAQRNYALTLASHEWVLCLDADERVAEDLREEIASGLETVPEGVDGFRVRRRTFYLGRWIEHGGWYPDRKRRLFRKSKTRFTGEDPHDLPEVDGTVEDLEGHIDHYTYTGLSHHLRTIDSFSSVTARKWEADGKRFRPVDMLVRPPWKFAECYLLKGGFLDGLPGFVIAAASSFYVFMKYAKLWEIQSVERGQTEKPGPD